MDVAQRSTYNNKLIVTLALQSRPSGKAQSDKVSEYKIVVFQFDYQLVDGKLKWTAEKLVSHPFSKPQITQLMYRPKCGLIVGCFRGYIELLDFKVKGDKTVLQRIDFWENQTKHRDEEADKAVALKKRRQKGPLMQGDEGYDTDDKDMTEQER